MLALSTSFAARAPYRYTLLPELLAGFDIDGVELEYRIPQPDAVRLCVELQRCRLPVVSIHNFFPFPAGRKGLSPGGDMYPLSSLDRETGKLAIDGTVGTIQHADSLECPLVVLHCGRVEMDTEVRKLHQFYGAGGIRDTVAQEFIAGRLAQREAAKRPYLDALKFSLEKLIRAVEPYGIRLALENRYHYHELPGPLEFEELFREFEGAPIAYWHDTGHAHAQEELTLLERGSLLAAFGGRLAGIHLHDATGLDDHLAPGRGEIDLPSLDSWISDSMPVVLELKPGTSEEEIRTGIQWWRNRPSSGTEENDSALPPPRRHP